jgi:acetoin utilization deacetylase AcuC-like enzyme
MYTTETEIDINDEPVNVTIDFNYIPGDPGVHTYSNGDPGYPPTSDEIEVLSMNDEDNNTVNFDMLDDAASEQVIQACRDYIEKLESDWEPDYPDTE